MHRDRPNPAPDISTLPAVLVVGSLLAFALFVGQLLLTPAVVGVLLGVGGAALAAIAATKLLRWALTAAPNRHDHGDEDHSPVDTHPSD